MTKRGAYPWNLEAVDANADGTFSSAVVAGGRVIRSNPASLPATSTSAYASGDVLGAKMQLADAIPGGGAVLPVAWCGYTLFGLGQPNRKDVRIELVDQTVLYRRITAAVEGGDVENLTLDASLAGSSIAPEYVRSISFMALSTLASDEVEIEHANIADVDATATTGWQAVVPDV